jgi:hypothetical protein
MNKPPEDNFVFLGGLGKTNRAEDALMNEEMLTQPDESKLYSYELN